ncbi:MAG TPA: AAA family ATPase [Candidatus Sulfomarinibacteraceae bacterium]|nr:AAA family ATPase [Candidatus Sulfomarinibacteraceae bacterium]
MDHPRLVQELKDPAFWGGGVEEVRYIQTHISSVFLTGSRVYKLKKPVNFGFLDYSTAELREANCRAEVTLNRRLAPTVYLGVVPVTVDDGRPTLDGAGEVVDWLVEMRQLDDDLLGTEVLARGELAPAHMEALVDVLVPFYSSAATGEGVDRFGTVDAVRFNTDENFSQTEAYVGKLISRDRFEHIRDWTNAFYERNAGLFERRIADGRIRESHGDLHLRNIFFEDPPVIFDCIEFSDRLRCGDVAVDIAFLAMDLDFSGRRDLSARFIDRFVAASGDTELLEVLDFYKCYRAYVRGKIACFTSADPALDDTARRAQRNLARRYFGLAYGYAGGARRPSLVVLYGLMGTGKTSVARHLRETRGWHVLSTDAVRKQIAGVGENTRVYVPYNHGLYSPEMNARTYAEVCDRAENLLWAGFPVVVDGAFKRRSERLPVIEAARRTGARLLFLETTCSPDEQRQRLEGRQRHDTRSDGRVELMDRQRDDFEPPDPDHAALFRSVDTSGPKAETQAKVEALLRDAGVV